MSPRSENKEGSSGPRAVQTRSLHKRQRILKAARKVFARYGFSKSSIEDIARKAGTGKATLYYHFDGKEDIFRAVVQAESDLFMEKVRNAVSKVSTPTEKFRTFVLVRYQYLSKLKTLYAITHQTVEELLPLAQKERDRYFEQDLDFLKKLLAEGVAEGSFELEDVEAAALVMLAGLWGFDTVVLTYDQATSIVERLDDMMDLVLRGLLRRD